MDNMRWLKFAKGGMFDNEYSGVRNAGSFLFAAQNDRHVTTDADFQLRFVNDLRLISK
jgi:hypothetical protein